MDVFVLVFLFYLSVIGHEFAHLISMQNKGVAVREFGIGMKKGPRISFLPKTGRFAGIRFSFYLLTFWLGAFNDADESLLTLPYKDRALVFCAGPFANIHFGCLLYILLFASTVYPRLCAYDTSGWGIEKWMLYPYYLILSSPYLWGSIVTIIILWFGRKFVSAYLAPVFGIVLLALLFCSIHNEGAVEYFSDVTGPVGFVAGLPEMATDMWSAVEWAAVLSIGLGAINLLPIYPLDGGFILLPIVEKILPRFVKFYKKSGLVLLIALMAFVIGKDIIMLVH